MGSTPFLLPPLVDIFGEVGPNTKAFQAFLDGTFKVPAECDMYVQKVMTKLVQPLAIQVIALPQLPQYISGWRKAWEAMSSSPSGVHFGHYIVGTHHGI